MRLATVLSACTLLLLPLAASAHLIGPSLEKQAGDALIDIGYDVPFLTSNISVTFNLALVKNVNSVRWTYAPYDDVLLTIRQGGREVFRKDQSVAPPNVVYASYVFPADGSYELSVRFGGSGKTLAEATFPLNAGEPGLGSWLAPYANFVGAGLTLLFVAGIAAWLLLRHPTDLPPQA